MFLGFPFKLFFFFVLFLGSLMSLSSSHWMGMWMGLELNLMSFIPLLMSISSVEEVESGVKYFLVQALGSSFFLWGGFWLYSMGMNFNFFSLHWFCSLILLGGLLLKMGSFPFHFWVPSVMSSLSWLGCMLLATWQKLAPLFIFFWFFFDSWFFVVLFLSVFCSIIGGLGGINQVQIRVLMAYSSINHLGWMMAVSTISFFGLSMYYMVYFFISLFLFLLFSTVGYGRVSQLFGLMTNKFILLIIMMVLVSLAGLPPFTGFFAKWIVFQEMLLNNQIFFLIFLVLGSVFSLYFYLNLFFSVFLTGFSYSLKFSGEVSKSLSLVLIMMMILSVLGLGFFELFYVFFI